MKIRGYFLSAILPAVLCLNGNLLAYSGGSGTAAEPYQINTYDDFIMLVETSADWGKSFILTANIDLSADTWPEAVIAWDTNSTLSGFQGTPFSGSFNGNHHVLGGLKITAGKDFLGLFGKLSYAVISNLTLQNAQVAGTDNSTYAGILAGWSEGCTITNCTVSGTLTAGNTATYIGGITGYSKYSTIQSSQANTSVTVGNTARYIGGMVGKNQGAGSGNGSIIQSCQATVSVLCGSASHEIGGLAGENDTDEDVIRNSTVSGSVEGGDNSSRIGGITGFNFSGTLDSSTAENITVKGGVSAARIGGVAGANYGFITGCSSTATLQGATDSERIGGLVGDNYGKGVIANCTADCTVTGSSGSTDLGGLVGENETPAVITACRAEGTITGGEVLGGLIGRNSGTINRSLSSALVTGPDTLSTFGGLIGYNSGTITKSCALGSVQGGTSTTNLGGLAGFNSTGGSITSCYSTAAVSGGNSAFRIGGLIGYIAGGSVADCYSGGTVSGGAPSYYLGGLVGYFNSGTATVNNCFATGAVSGQTGSLYLGGLIGVFVTGTLSNSFWDTQTTLMTSAAGASAGTSLNVLGKTTEEMKTQSTYTAYGWDYLDETTNGFAATWRMCVDHVNYPKLTWQHIQIGDFACPDGSNTDDLRRLGEDWLLSYSTDLFGADATGDKSVNLNDLAILAVHWLEGI